MLALHLDNWLFFIFAAIALLFRWLSSTADKNKTTRSDEPEGSEDQPRSWTPSPPEEREPTTDSERIRKFLEALGQPTNAPPPPRVAPRVDVPARPLAPVSPPQRMVVFPKKQAQPRPPALPKTITAPLPQPRQFRAPAEVPIFEIQGGSGSDTAPTPMPHVAAAVVPAKTEATVAKPETNIVQLLRSPGGLRNAIILREIFGPPRSMQPLDFTGTA